MEVSQTAFWHSADIDKIAGALAKAQGVLDNASKSALNPHFNRKYADLASVMDACRKPLSDNEIAIIQCPSATETELSMVTFLVHSSGQFFASRLCMVPRDNSPQSAGSTITYARRYALLAMAGVAPDDDDDAEAGQGRPIARRPSPPPPPRTPPAKAEIPEPQPAAPPPNLPWSDRPAMEAAFAALKQAVGDSHYHYILSLHDVTPDLRGKVAKLTEAYAVLKTRADELKEMPQ